MGLRRPFACILIILILAAAQSATAASYSVVDLGILPAISSTRQSYASRGLGISEAGQATGQSNVYVNNVEVRHGFYWNNGTLTDIDAANPTENTFVNGMSPDGNVVGARGVGFAFSWSQAAGFTNLQPLGGASGNAFGMNTLGDVVGESDGTLTFGTAWKSGAPSSPIKLSPFGSLFFTTAQAINSNRTIVGYSYNNSGSSVATVWNYLPGSGTWDANNGQSLGTLGGIASQALDINTAGNIVGNSTRASGQGTGAFIWHPGDSSLTDLNPGGAMGNTFAKGINDNNEVVGSIFGSEGFVWDSAHGMRNLQDLIDPNSPFLITDAKDVNNNGWIIGTANDSNDGGLEHAVILKPIPLAGDYNNDGHVNAADIAALELALTNATLYTNTYGLTSTDLMQLDQLLGKPAHAINNSDLQALLIYLKTGNGSTAPVPEPSTAVLALLTLISTSAWSLQKHRREVRL